MLGEDLTEPVERAFGPTGDQHPSAGAPETGDVAHRMIEHIGRGVGAFGSEAASSLGACVDDPTAGRFGRVERRQVTDQPFRSRRGNLLGRQVEQVGRRGFVGGRIGEPAAIGLVATGLVMIVDHAAALGKRVMGERVEHHRSLGQIVEHRFQPVMEKGQPVLHAGETPAFADRGVKRVVARGRAESLYIGAPEAADRLGRQRDLARRLQHHLGAPI
jgi:hypothetical protein